MVGTIQYGGRITDDFDRKLMEAYAEKYYHQASREYFKQAVPRRMRAAQKPSSLYPPAAAYALLDARRCCCCCCASAPKPARNVRPPTRPPTRRACCRLGTP
jgi:hypothetical protein